MKKIHPQVNALPPEQVKALLQTLEKRFEKNNHRHKGIKWAKVLARLEPNADKIWSLNEMEETGGEPDIAGYDKKTDQYIFYDLSPETPKGRRSLCYDRAAQLSRKEHPPKNNAIDMAVEIGITILTEQEYRYLQEFGPLDTKTSSWLITPADIRKLDGAIFADYRYGKIFVYHNGASSYYAARGFRGSLRV